MKPQPLPAGQINPAAKPVSAFIQPVDYQVQRAPNQAMNTPALQPLTTIQTAGTGSVQGQNNAAQLASALAKFNPAMEEGLMRGGWMIARNQMDIGESQALAAASNAAQEAEKNNDEQMEAAEAERAAANRKLAIKSPYEGGLMNMLNPYRQMGWQRGISKALALKLQAEVPLLASQLGPSAYLSPSMGAADLTKLRSDKVQELFKAYGYSAGDPGFQTNVLPALNKASDKATQQLLQDRTKWLDQNSPRILAAQIGQALDTSNQTREVEIQLPGDKQPMVYRQADDPDAFEYAQREQIRQIQTAWNSKAGLPGLASKWDQAAFEQLMAQADFQGDTVKRRLLESLPSNVPAIGSDGQPLKDQFGQVVPLTWGEAYGQTSVDSQIKYGQARWSAAQLEYKEAEVAASTFVQERIQDLPPGPARTARALEALQEWADTVQEATGARPNATVMSRLRRSMPSLLESEAELYGAGFDPQAGLRWEQGFDQRVVEGTQGNRGQELERLNQAVENMPPEDRDTFYTRAKAKLDSLFKADVLVSRFPSVGRDIQRRIEANKQLYYTYQQETQQADVAESVAKQYQFYRQRVGAALAAEEDRLGRPLKELEATQVADDVMNNLAKDEAALRPLFPGSATFPDPAPSVDPSIDPPAAQEGPQSEQVDRQDTSQYPTYPLQELGTVPASRARLYKKYALMKPNDLRQVIKGLIDNPGAPIPPPLLQVMSMAGVADPFEFLDAQKKIYRNLIPDWTPAQYESLRKRLQASTGMRANSIATIALQNRGLTRLAALSNSRTMA